jgi:DNA-binding response OmpR family regulator
MVRLLVVDDDRLTAEGTAQFFEGYDWEVVTAHDVSGALEALKTRFDAVLLDRVLDLKDGGERVLAEFKAHSDFNSTCVVLFTGYGSPESAVRCLAGGAFDYVEKPIDLRDLHRVLVAGIARKRADILRGDVERPGC